MPEGKEEEEKVTPEPVEGEETEKSTETPTVAELPQEVKAELEKLRGEVGQLNIGLARKEGEVKKLRERQAQPASAAPTSKALEVILADMKARGTETGEANPRIAQVEAILAAEGRDRDTARERQEVETYTQGRRDTMESKIRNAGLDPEDEQFDGVWDRFNQAYYQDGPSGFDIADKRLDRIVSKVKPQEKGKEDDTAKVIEDEVRRRLKEAGLLTTETGQPSASGETWVEFEARYVKGEIDEKTYEKRAKKEGKL